MLSTIEHIETFETFERATMMHYGFCRKHADQTGEGGCPECAMDSQHNELTALRDLLTSVRAICARGGRDTNWEALDKRIASFGIGPITPRTFRIV